MTHEQFDPKEVTFLKSRMAALEQLLIVYEQTTIEQFERLESALNTLTKRAVELETVARISVGVSTVLDTTELLQAVVDTTKANFGLYHAHVYLLNDRGDVLKLVAGSGEIGRRMVGESWQIPLNQERSLVARAARTRTGVIVNDVRQAPDWLPNPLLPDTRSELAVPLIIGQRVLGVLDVQSDQISRFTKEDAHIQTTLAAQVAVSLENARLFEQVRRSAVEMEEQTRLLTLLNEMGTELNQAISFNQILAIAMAKIGLMVNADDIRLALMSDTDRKVDVFALNSPQEIGNSVPLALEETSLDLVMGERRIIHTQDLVHSPFHDLRQLAEKGIRSVICVPLIATGRAVGTLSLGRTQATPYRPQEEASLAQVASLLATTIQNQRLLQQAQAHARREQTLREVAARVRASVDVETIMQLAAQEVGQTLKRSAFIYLSQYDDPQTDIDRDPTWQGSASREGWQTFQITRQDRPQGYLFEEKKAHLTQIDESFSTELAQPASGKNSAIQPMLVQGEVIGQLGVYDQAEPLSRDEQEFLGLVAAEVSEALERARLLEQAQRRAVELGTVIRVSNAASATLDTINLMQTVVDLAKSSFELYHVHIYLYDEIDHKLKLVAGSDQVGREMVAEGREISLEQGRSLIARGARERRGIIINNVRQEADFLPHPALPETRSELVAPIVAGERLLGVLDVQDSRVNRFTPEDLRIQTTLAAQVGIALQNANLFQQMERALAETEILYQVGNQLNAIVNLEQVLQIIALSEVSAGVGSATLLIFDSYIAGEPKWAELVAACAYDHAAQETLSIPVGARIGLSHYPFEQVWSANRNEPTLIGSIADDPRVKPQLAALCQQAGMQAIAILPLRLGRSWVGLASLIWTNQRQFTERDKRLYQSIAGQAAVVINNWLLLRQAEKRAGQLEKLAHTEADLSRVTHETDILVAIAPNFDLGPSERLVLEYIDVNDEGQPVTSCPMAIWQDGHIQPDDPELGQNYLIAASPVAKLWIKTPGETIFISDLKTDERVEDGLRAVAAERGLCSMALLPLFSGGRWQGLISAIWNETQEFTPDQRFMFQQLVDPLAAIVASRRAYLAQQATLAETEMLYNTIRRVNEASNLQEIVTAFTEGISIPAINRAVLAVFEYDLADNVQNMWVAANWYSGQGTPPPPPGVSYPFQLFTAMGITLGHTPLFFSDIQRSEQLDPHTLQILQDANILAMAILPLWSSARQLEVLLLEAEETHYFTGREQRTCTSLAGQVGIAIDNQQLLTETRAALAQVEATQRRYTLQAWEAYQARSSATAYDQFREGKSSSERDLPPEVGQAIRQREVIVTSPAAPVIPESNDEAGNGAFSSSSDQSNLIVPLIVRDEVIGVLGLQELDEPREWLPEEIALVEIISREMAQVAENLRLLDETQQRVAREKRINEINEKIQAAQTLEEALKIAVKEVGLSLQVPETTIQLSVRPEDIQ